METGDKKLSVELYVNIIPTVQQTISYHEFLFLIG